MNLRAAACGIARFALGICLPFLFSPTVAAQTPCEELPNIALPENVAQISAELVTSGTFLGRTGLPEFCRVALIVEPKINIEIWLPTDTYNGRFQAIGGGGYAGGINYGSTNPGNCPPTDVECLGIAHALRNGYATASTDTGHSRFEMPGGSFALGADGELNWQLIEDFASRAIFEKTKLSHQLIEAFYGQHPAYSYWHGCSTGGRQGLMIAQRLPGFYDGIMAGAPANNWDRFIPAELWPQVVMQRELGGPIASCKLAAASQAAVDHCDTLDGVADGVIDDPRRCDFNASSLIWLSQDPACGAFTEAEARVIQMIWDGPRATDGAFLWYGLPQGAPLNALAGTNPFPITVDHFRYWIRRDPSFDWRTLDYATYENDFRQSQALFNEVIGTDNPDLSGFRDAGGKLIIWHGWNDQLMTPA